MDKEIDEILKKCKEIYNILIKSEVTSNEIEIFKEFLEKEFPNIIEKGIDNPKINQELFSIRRNAVKKTAFRNIYLKSNNRMLLLTETKNVLLNPDEKLDNENYCKMLENYISSLKLGSKGNKTIFSILNKEKIPFENFQKTSVYEIINEYLEKNNDFKLGILSENLNQIKENNENITEFQQDNLNRFFKIDEIYSKNEDSKEVLDSFLENVNAKCFTKEFWQNNIISRIDKIENIEDIYAIADKFLESSDVKYFIKISLYDKLKEIDKGKGADKYLDKLVQDLSSIILKSKSKSEKISKRSLNVISDYLDKIPSTDNSIELLNNNTFSEILKLVTSSRINQNEVKEIFENKFYIRKIDINKNIEYIDNYINKISDKTVKSENEIDEFIKNIYEVKLASNKNIDQKYVFFVLSQIMKEDNVFEKNPEKYFGFLKLIVEEFTKNSINRPVDYTVSFTNEFQKNSNGIHIGGTKQIILNDNLLKKFIENKDLKLLDTALHEGIHAEQRFDLDNKNASSYLRYIQKKENIIRLNNSNFKENNYNEMFVEIEARERSKKKLANILSNILPKRDDNSLDFNVMFLSASQNIVDFLDNEVQKEQEFYKSGMSKFSQEQLNKSEDNKKYVNDIFFEILQNKPELLEQNPILKLEYKIDEHNSIIKKSCTEILQDAKNMKVPLKLCSEIIKHGNIINLANFSQTVNEILEYSQDTLKDKTILRYIVNENFKSVLDEFFINEEKLTEDEKIEFLMTIDKIENIVEKEPQSAFAMGMTSKGVVNKFSEYYDISPLDILNDNKEKLNSIRNLYMNKDIVDEELEFFLACENEVTSEEKAAMSKEIVLSYKDTRNYNYVKINYEVSKDGYETGE